MTVSYDTHCMSRYIASAVADGWEVAMTPQEGSSRDRSVTITKSIPELNGFLKVLLVDRDITTYRQSSYGSAKTVGSSFPDISIKAWLVSNSARMGMKELSKELKVGLYDMGEYSLKFWLKKAHFCTSCGRAIAVTDVRRIYFTGLVCARCEK